MGAETLEKEKKMENSNRTHPLVIAAAVAVLASSALAAAVLTGVLPSAVSKNADQGSLPEPAAVSSSAAPVQPAAPSTQARQHTLARAAVCASCGVIESVQSYEAAAPTSGVGAVAGGVTGAVVGNQFGRGAGRTAMTLLGAAGGALAGNAIEKNTRKHLTYRISVRMDDGTHRTLTREAPPAQVVGERVRVVDGQLEHLS